jgi:hypothetical protein
MTEVNPCGYLHNRADHPAVQDRFLAQAFVNLPGIYFNYGAGQFDVTAQGTPNMTVNVAGGLALITGSDVSQQGVYVCFNDPTPVVVAVAASTALPRNDLVVARVQDAFYSGAINAWKIDIVQGTPNASPVDPTITFGNYIRLARIRVAASVSSIDNAHIDDLRQWLQTGRGANLTAPGLGSSTGLVTTTSATYVTTGTTVSVPFTAPASGAVYINMTAEQYNSAAAGIHTSVDVTATANGGMGGVQTGLGGMTASDTKALAGSSILSQATRRLYLGSLTPRALYTATMKHRVDSGTGNFSNRELLVEATGF